MSLKNRRGKPRTSRRNLPRRLFLRNAAATATTLIAPPVLIPSAALGAAGNPAPSDRITVGIIGAGGINSWHLPVFLSQPDTRVIAVCDPFRHRRLGYKAGIDRHYGDQGCADYEDFRDLLDRSDLDAVCIGVPDHWHAAISVRAMEAGKDVYCEKPLSRTVVEGRRMVETAERYGRVFQTGLQRRSSAVARFACELVRNGRIGKLHTVEVGIIGLNPGIQIDTHFPSAPIPDGFNYDLWLGPAPEKPYCPQRVNHGTATYWFYIDDYTNGFISGNGVHFVDVAQWGIGDGVNPREVDCTFARFPSKGLIDDAIEWRAEILYENGVRLLYSNQDNPYPSGMRFIGTEGSVFYDGGSSILTDPPGLRTSLIGPNEIQLYRSLEPHRNLLDCIRQRRRTAVPAETGHRATTPCNLVDISARLKRRLVWDASEEEVLGDLQASRMLSRAYRGPWCL